MKREEALKELAKVGIEAYTDGARQTHKTLIEAMEEAIKQMPNIPADRLIEIIRQIKI